MHPGNGIAREAKMRELFINFGELKMLNVLRSTKGFKPYRTLMEKETINALLDERENYGVLGVFKKMDCLVLKLDRHEGETRIILHPKHFQELYQAPRETKKRRKRAA